MQDNVDAEGNEEHIVIDGQQRVTAVLGFINREFQLEGDEVARQWQGLGFDDLNEIQKKTIFGYKFVVRVLPSLDEDQIRKIFSRLNRNTVALNDQELRNATYSGGFIKLAQKLADEDEFWSEFGIFSAKDHRRMLDQEYISELMAALLHGHQNKKDRLDTYYQQYEQVFEAQDRLEAQFRKLTGEIAALIPPQGGSRWRKKSDFYTLFTVLAEHTGEFPWTRDRRKEIADKLLRFGEGVDALTRIDEQRWGQADQQQVAYAQAVSRAASDRNNRIQRFEALKAYLFGDQAAEAAVAG